MNRIEAELHRLRIALLDHSDPRYKEFWAAQQALAWANDPESFAPPFSALRGSEVVPAGCFAAAD